MSFNLDSYKYYLNREITWLKFNDRVLNEAINEENPLFERLKFLSITSSNLDEFFMIRVAGIKEQIEAKYEKKDPSGLTALEQFKEISKYVHFMVKKQDKCLNKYILPELKKRSVNFLNVEDLNKNQYDFLKNYFNSTIYPVITPMAIDQSRPFPLLPNKMLTQAILLNEDGKKPFFAMVQVPPVLPRFIRLPGSKSSFIALEKVIKEFINSLFIGYEVLEVSPFRITRNADLNINDDAMDLLEEIEKSLRQRRMGFPVRLEIAKNAPLNIKQMLKNSLSLENEDIYEIDSMLNLADLMKFSNQKGFEKFKYKPFLPQPSPIFFGKKDLFKIIRKKDVLLHHPYESFEPVIDFLEQAANDPDVLAIKQTLYRVSGDSPVIKNLIKAAENGKQVTVLVELKARFDEERNIHWAKKLEDAGCYVIYGLVGLKTHTKILLVVRNEEDGIKRYVHMSTGNYNDSTAKLYTDIGLFTSDDLIGQDASALFNLLTGYSKETNWNKLYVAPLTLKSSFIEMVEKERKLALEGKKGIIKCVMNSLLDKDVIKAFYKASIDGVQIDLVVRGICTIIPGIKNLSENIRVRSIVGRFLEHSRIYYFNNDGDPKIYLSSADMMPRNLVRRVETMFPIESEALKKRVIDILNLVLTDNVKTRRELPNGNYRMVRSSPDKINSQELFCQMAIDNFKNMINSNSTTEKFKPQYKIKE